MDQVRQIFSTVAGLDESARQAYYAQAAVPEDIRQAVEALLQFDQTLGGTFESNLDAHIADVAGASAPADGERFGPYRLVRLIAQGGMGSVYLGERVDGEVDQRVAIKLLNWGDDALRSRFLLERQILARLEHPAIARLLDTGQSAQGKPYLAMEYVEGVPIDQFAANLDWRGRVRLFLQVCEAVSYAHRNLIVHRDLKPSNILVDTAGRVKLLDFGIAKVLNEGASAVSTVLAMTPQYASPEQCLGKPVTTATDIYSLGVVLYKMVTGRLPYDVDPGSNPAAYAQVICEAGPKAPNVDPDLDKVLLMALRKEPERRYLSVEQFSGDLARVLADEPILARTPSWGYRFQKFLRRNWVSVTAGVAVFLALVTGTGVAMWQAREARKAARVAKAVQTFVTDIFETNTSDQPDPVRARETTARQLLDIGAGKLSGSLKDAPEAKLEVLETLAHLYCGLGLEETCVKLARERVALARSVFGSNSPEVAAALLRLASNAKASRSAQEIPELVREAKEILDRAGDSTSKLRAELLFNLAENDLEKNPARALEFVQESVRLSRTTSRDILIQALLVQGLALNSLNRDREAIPAFSEAIPLAKEEQWNGTVVQLYAYRADAQSRLLDLNNAEQSFRATYELAKSLNGPDHVDTLQTENRLGTFLAKYGKDQEGLRLLEDGYRRSTRVRGTEDARNVPMIQRKVGVALARNGRLKEGIDLLQMAIAQWRKHYSGTLPLAMMLEETARYEIDLGHFERAEKEFDEADAIRKNSKASLERYGRVKLLLAEGKPTEAEQVLGPAHPIPEQLTEVSLVDVHDQAAVKLAQGDFESANRIASTALARIAAHPDRKALTGFEEPLLQIKGAADLAAGKSAPALTLFEDLIRRRTERLDPNSPLIVESRLGAAEAAAKSGRAAEQRQFCAAARTVIVGVPLGEQYKKRLNRVCGI